MRTISLVKIASLALVLAAPLASIANAGDHSGDQWRSDNDGAQIATTYYHADPALVQMELRVYRADVARSAQETASFTPGDFSAKGYLNEASPGLVQMEQRSYQADVARAAKSASVTQPDAAAGN